MITLKADDLPDQLDGLVFEYNEEEDDYLEVWFSLSILNCFVVVEVTKQGIANVWTDRYGDHYVSYDREDAIPLASLGGLITSRFYAVHRSIITESLNVLTVDVLRARLGG